MRWTCRRWRNTSSVGELLIELQWPSLEARRDQSSLLFFHKIQCGIMSIDKDKYLTLSQRTRSTRASYNSQYCRLETYNDALKYSFIPRTIPHWNSLAPTVVAAETMHRGVQGTHLNNSVTQLEGFFLPLNSIFTHSQQSQALIMIRF